MSKETHKLEEEIKDLKARLLRSLADYDNLQKRALSEKEVLVKRANLNLFKDILPFLDLVKKAQENLNDPALALVAQNFEELIKKEGLEKVGLVGEDFNPAFHEVLTVVPGKEDGKIAEVITPGYIAGDWVVRPAMVKVTKKDD